MSGVDFIDAVNVAVDQTETLRTLSAAFLLLKTFRTLIACFQLADRRTDQDAL